MSNVKNALTRKVGPLPVWAWGILAFVAVWYYRNKLSAASTSSTSTTPTDANPPQPGQVLEPGESYYDPNTGELVTAPGGGGTASPINGLSPNGTPGATPPGATTTPATPGGTAGRLTRSAWNKRWRARTTRGFNARWLQKKAKKTKRSAATTRAPSTRRRAPRATPRVARPRNTFTTAGVRGGRVPPDVATLYSEGRPQRQRPKTGITRKVIRQRPVATHPKPKEPAAHIPPRPSNPPTRQIRNRTTAARPARRRRAR